MKNGYNPFLKGGSQIDEQIAATNNIHPGEGRILKNILPGKDAEIADGLADLIALLHFVKKAAQPGRRDVGHDTFLVDSRSGLLDRGLAQVCAENLQCDVYSYLRQILHQRNSVRVSFFTGGAAGYPHTKSVVGSPVA